MSEAIIIDKNGESIWGSAEERLSEVQQWLLPELEKIKQKIEENEQKQYPAKLNFLPRITNFLDAHLRLKPLITFELATSITSAELQNYATAFFKLLIFIREYVPDYIANKQIFCAFISISTSAFDELQNSNNGEICAVIESLLDSFKDTNMTGAMGGAVNSTATFNRMRAKGAGYGVTLKADEQQQANNTVFLLDNDAIQRKLKQITNRQ